MWDFGSPVGVPSGHVFRVERARGPVWYAKYRLPDGRQVQKKLGLAWTGRGRPAAGYFTKRLAEDWLRYVEHDRQRKPSTIAGYRALVRSQLLPAFGQMPIESITTPIIEQWLASADPVLPQIRASGLGSQDGPNHERPGNTLRQVG